MTAVAVLVEVAMAVLPLRAAVAVLVVLLGW